jgi:hypothetical protein
MRKRLEGRRSFEGAYLVSFQGLRRNSNTFGITSYRKAEGFVMRGNYADGVA